jgi:putative ABC transport system ATP-binding protein
MIRVRDLHKTYPPDRHVLRGLELEIDDGAFVSIVGRSGSGKTTLLNIIGGLDTRYQGVVEVEGSILGDLTDNGLSELRATTFGHVFQAYHLLERLTVAENAALSSLFTRGSEAFSRKQVRRRAERVLEEVGLWDRADDRPGVLSGGERQRLALARALFAAPRVLLCDEPTGNLDSDTGSQVAELLARIHGQREVTVVVATHDDVISRPVDRELRLCDGVLEEAT